MLGIFGYAVKGTTPEPAYHSLLALFCRTRGLSNDLLHTVVRVFHPCYRLRPAQGALGNLSPSDLETAVGALRQNGFYVFPKQLSAETCGRLTEIALRTPCHVNRGGNSSERRLYEWERPLAEQYMLPEGELINEPAVQELMADPSLLTVAQAYLRNGPILDIVAMWWSTPFSKQPNTEAAQLYHFDMDRIKWLKFFFYLTDVTSVTGPHCFIRGTHRRFSQPAQLLNRGYTRIADQDLAPFYAADQFVEICGPRGTIVAVDTRGFHKGKPPETTHRLVLQFEYCDTLFGGGFTKSELVPQANTLLSTAVEQYPRLFSKFTIGPVSSSGSRIRSADEF